jgi:hypothetical protein
MGSLGRHFLLILLNFKASVGFRVKIYFRLLIFEKDFIFISIV